MSSIFSNSAGRSEHGFDLRAILRNYIVEKVIFGGAPSATPTWKVLVVDDLTARILSHCMKVSDLTIHGVTVIEKIQLQRKAWQDQEAVYFLRPTTQNVEFLLKDFPENRGITVSKRLYASARVYFSAELPREHLRRISESKGLTPYIRALAEVPCNMLSLESHAFILNTAKPGYPDAFWQTVERSPYDALSELISDNTTKAGSPVPDNRRRYQSSFLRLYQPGAPVIATQELERQAAQLASVFALMKAYPLIRFARPPASARIFQQSPYSMTQAFAQAVQARLDSMESLNPGTFAVGAPVDLVIVDRTIDLYAPLLHEFTYQAMTHDLLGLEDRIQNKTHSISQRKNESGKPSTGSVFLLTEDDPVWNYLRHRHIADCLQTLPTEFRQFLKEDVVASHRVDRQMGNDSGSLELEDINKLMRQMPRYSLQLSKFAIHIELLHLNMKNYTDLGLEAIALQEQQLALGHDYHDDKPLTASGMLDAITRIATNHSAYDGQVRRRMLLLYAISIFNNALMAQHNAQSVTAAFGKTISSALENSLSTDELRLIESLKYMVNLTNLGPGQTMPGSTTTTKSSGWGGIGRSNQPTAAAVDASGDLSQKPYPPVEDQRRDFHGNWTQPISTPRDAVHPFRPEAQSYIVSQYVPRLKRMLARLDDPHSDSPFAVLDSSRSHEAAAAVSNRIAREKALSQPDNSKSGAKSGVSLRNSSARTSWFTGGGKEDPAAGRGTEGESLAAALPSGVPAAERNKPVRTIVFVLGGATYSELRALYEASQTSMSVSAPAAAAAGRTRREFVLGTWDFVLPSGMLQDLSLLRME
ncbi:hypothetical protein H696_03082 [Fonticula alba]|uniref:Sec1-like protein n=1 Tax=Fonticula alba TaxID=691883 RepID=A0A058Z9E8_FONAL|nr:hypothetical protein H696_03082 [Fonticula alba]KCV70731.1 hypothetical protein H696_03082 [Fonticula alba]|eukprot:XP_009495247.1 hypothetical protein H696_03082 [Fonticula alba]